MREDFMPKILTFRPRFDLASEYCHTWVGKIMDYAAKRGYEVVDLEGEAATQANFFSAIEEEQPDVVVIGTHGIEDKVVAQWDQPLLLACTNDAVFKGRACYYGTCLAGLNLGKSTSMKGSPLVLAYLREFVWHINVNYPPERDPVAKPFGDLYVEPAFALLDGLEPTEIYERSMKKYDEIYSEIAGGRDPSTAMMLSDIDNNRRALIVYGEKTTLVAPSVNWLPLAVLGAGAVGLYFLLGGRK